MSSLITGYEFDIFISYSHKDNLPTPGFGRHESDGWVTQFVADLRKELESISKEDISIYFDENPRDGLPETYQFDKSAEGKLKSLIFIPIISQTYCDPKSFVWQHEFLAFISNAKENTFGTEASLLNDNISNRIIPVKIHDIDATDNTLIEKEIGQVRSIDFIVKSAGVNRSLTQKDDELRSPGQILYRDQINKVANTIKDILSRLRGVEPHSSKISNGQPLSRKPYIKPHIKNRIQKILAIAALLIGILGTFLDLFGVLEKFTDTSDTPKREKSITAQFVKSIAVLPFKNIGPDDSDEYFSVGMTEEVINYLAKVSDLKVISRTSIEQYKGSNKDIREIAEELGVTYILEGSVRKAGNTFRISVQLIQAETGFNLWSDGYDRAITDILQVQSDISKEVTDVLKIVLSESEKINIENIQPVELTAYDFYLKARSELMNYRTAGQTKGQGYLNNAIALFKSSLAEDPTFPRAYSGLGLALINKHNFQVMYIEKSFLDSAKLLADKSLELDNKTDEAYFVRGIYFSQIGKTDDALKEFQKALQLNPNYADAMMSLGKINNSKHDFVTGLTQMERSVRLERGPELANNLRTVGSEYFVLGLYDKTEEFCRQAMRLDNDSIPLYSLKAHMERVKHNYELALNFSNEAYRMNPDDWGHVDQKAMILSFLGRHQEALDVLLDWVKQNGSQTNMHIRIGYLYWVLGNQKKGHEHFRQTIKIAEKGIEINSPYGRSIAHYDLAAIYAFIGETEKAYQHLEKIIKWSFIDAWLISLIEVDPLFEKITKEEHFKKIILQMKSKNIPQRDRVVKWLKEEEMKTKIERL